jgi:hypothetical protein
MAGFSGHSASTTGNGTSDSDGQSQFDLDAAAEADAERVSQQFQQFDANNDGVLDEEETKSLLETLTPPPTTPGEAVPQDCMDVSGEACRTCIVDNVCTGADKAICDFNQGKFCGTGGQSCNIWNGDCITQQFELSGKKIRIAAAGVGVSATAAMSLLALSLVPVVFRWYNGRRHPGLLVTDETREEELEAPTALAL